ncbi:lytic murein transglycosylase [Phyllobacterium salinisoli]|uniref:Lytic murein transglycosylase n=1 Tax=Phyllobacterium salinisoli TaxID=1899321 RepID=A0A368K296_9HYPH|nr:lytic murein transglycosylase [Phyllobacterium salinisoli]
MNVSVRLAPLCPAGHLPRRGGDWLTLLSQPIVKRVRLAPRVYEGVISPLAGEMAGKPEGGAVPLRDITHAPN